MSGKELKAGIERVGAQDGGGQEPLGREQPESTAGPAIDLTEQGINFHARSYCDLDGFLSFNADQSWVQQCREIKQF